MEPRKIELAGKEYYIAYNGAAMFALHDIKNIFETIQTDFDAFCKVVQVMTEQGELVRRYRGYDACGFVDPDELRVMATPLEVLEMKRSILQVIVDSMKREVGDAKKKNETSASKNSKSRQGKKKSSPKGPST